MVRIIVYRELPYNEAEGRKAYIEASGLSTDEKPTSVLGVDVATGSFFHEVDTTKVYAYDEETTTWTEQLTFQTEE